MLPIQSALYKNELRQNDTIWNVTDPQAANTKII